MVYIIAGLVAVAIVAGVGYYLYTQGKLPVGKKAEGSGAVASSESNTEESQTQEGEGSQGV